MAAISTIQIDIADFLLTVLETPVEARGEWLTQFARSLAKRDLEGHPYACKCLLEVDEYRKREAQRKADIKKGRSNDSAESKDSKESADSDNFGGIPPHTDNQSINQTNNQKKKRTAFAVPSVDEVRAYCFEKNYTTDPESFVAFYGSKGWKVGNQPMKDWKLALVTWEKRNGKSNGTHRTSRADKLNKDAAEFVRDYGT